MLYLQTIMQGENPVNSSNNYVFTSESVSEGHPDKIADQISDGILDACLSGDPLTRSGCETIVKNNTVILAGEITTSSSPDYDSIAREVIRNAGYTDPDIGFDADSCEVLQFINEQSPDIKQGVDEGAGTDQAQGAGDQGLMFGLACNETPEKMPLAISLSHAVLRKLAEQRKSNKVDFLRPDSKAQITVRYESGKPVAVETVVLSTQHTENVSLEDLEQYIRATVIPESIPPELLTERTTYLVNPTGKFIVGGPVADCGLTGRKIIVDTYGGYSRHGGGAFSGKDPSKVDRSASYAARYVAKNIVAAGIADKCEVQLAYAIGVAEPVSIYVDTFGTGKVSEEKITDAIRKEFDLTPKGIIESLNLLRPIYSPTAVYGHFGRTPSEEGFFSWEKTDRVENLQNMLL